MIKLAFRDPVSLTGLVIRATKGPKADDLKEFEDEDEGPCKPFPPRLIKLFANKPQLDFTDAVDMKAGQDIKLSKKHIKGNKIQLKALKFQRCTSLQIFIVENQNQDSEKNPNTLTYLNRIGLIGRLSKAYHTEYGK